MSDLRHQALELLEDIGGDVKSTEVAYHLGRDAVYELVAAAELGLVETTTFFSLTQSGRDALSSPSPEGQLAAFTPAEELGGSPAPGPGGAGSDLPPTGFAACHGRAA